MFRQVIRYMGFNALFICILLIILGCYGEDGADGVTGPPGSKGDDGKSYIAYTWVDINWVSTDDPAFGSSITSGTPYRTNPGRYSFSYESWDGSPYSGTYYIYIEYGWGGSPGQPGEPGEPGGLFWQDGKDGDDGARGADGADGDDIWFELVLLSTGPSFYAWPDPSYLGKSINNSVEPEMFKKSVGDNTTGKRIVKTIEFDYDRFMDEMSAGEPIEVSGVLGKYRYTLRYVQVK